jgi:DinB superfamily
VEHETCSECGFDGADYDDAALLAQLRALGPSWRALLDGAGTELRVRPAEGVWSAIEYAAHSRDITALHAFGVEQALTLDEPAFPAVEPGLADAAAVSYGIADPDEVVAALDAAAMQLAGRADAAGSDAWSQGLTLGTERIDVRRLLEHALHDSTHHLDDVERGFAQLRGRG